MNPPPFEGERALIEKLRTLDHRAFLRDGARAVGALVRAHDGVFPDAAPNRNPLSFQALQQYLLSLLHEPPLAERGGQLEYSIDDILGQFLAFRALHPCLHAAPGIDGWERITRKLWFTALEQELLSRTPKYEIARAWVMFEKIWPDLLARGKFHASTGSQRSAAGAMHNALLFTAALYVANGWVEDRRAYFANTTLGGSIDALVASFSVRLQDLHPRLAPQQPYPDRAFLNPFIGTPVVVLPGEELLAPDPAALFVAFERTMTLKVLRESVLEDPGEGFDTYSRAIGNVYEEYVNRVLRADGVQLGGRYQPEFRYGPPGQELDSPDAFVLRPRRSIVIECKATRFPNDVEQLLRDPGEQLLGWIRKILGATPHRAPLDQGQTFFRQAAGLQQLDGHDLGDALYLIAIYPTVPQMLNSMRWREDWLCQRLPELQCDLFSRVVFVSVRDLEIALSASQAPGHVGTFADLISAWWTELGNAELRNLPLSPSLGDYILQLHPVVAQRELSMLQEARAELYLATEAAGFAASAWSMPKGLWDQPLVRAAQLIR